MKQMQIFAFDMNCVGHINHGMWTHPTRYLASIYGSRLVARTAERGKLDGIFLADILGVYDVYKNSAAPVIQAAAQLPCKRTPWCRSRPWPTSPGTSASE